jgi:hypothetical protein
MPVIPAGSNNNTGILVPDVYVQIQSPSTTLINGIPTNIMGVVGTATWGPVNAPVNIGSWAEYVQTFGQLQVATFDMGTPVNVATLQGANNFMCVRVTDGTDVAATVNVMDITTPTPVIGMVVNAKYTGVLGNGLQVTIATGSRSTSGAPTFQVIISMPGYPPEVFDNIGGTGATLWANIVAAINLGQTSQRGASQYISATAGTSTATPALSTYSLTGGTNGNSGVTASSLVGTDGVSRTGMYSLRSKGCSVAMLSDATDPTTWPAQVAYGLSEGTYMIAVGAAGQSIATAIANKNTAGISSYTFRLNLGDWCYFNDIYNNIVRLVSPQGFIAGILASLSPEQSALNKQLQGIVGTQRSSSSLNYSDADLLQLEQAGIDVIMNPCPGGYYFGSRIGHNTSSNPLTYGDNYTRLTNYIAYSLSASLGVYIGVLQTPEVRQNAKAGIQYFLQGMADQGQIGTADGSNPYKVILDNTNNSPSRVALGFMQADVYVTYLSVVEKFIVNLQGSQATTIITSQQTQQSS